MNIQTKEGMAEGLPLSDIQENNRIMRNWEKTIPYIKALSILGWTIFTLCAPILIWTIYKIIKYDAFNNTLRSLGCVG